MTTKLGVKLAGVLALTVTSARADSFGTGPNAFTIDFVTIGNPGNADDRALDNTNNTPGDPNDDEYSSPYGGVPYGYRMGTFEISQDAITKATAGGLAGVTAGPWAGSQPAANMTWFEAAAFVNWLNDQRTPGLKAYNLTGVSSLTLWSSGDAWQAGGENLYRHKDAYYFLPSEDEWYKAAYHKNDGATANYWDYATGSNSIPDGIDFNGDTSFETVFSQGFDQGSPNAVTNAGLVSPYGTMGQNGNVWEWQESALDGTNDLSSEDRVFRAGNWFNPETNMRASNRNFNIPSTSTSFVGFRVASVPEPSSTVLMCSASLLALAQRRRRAAL